MLSAKIQIHYFQSVLTCSDEQPLAVPDNDHKKFKFLPFVILWKVQQSRCIPQLIMERQILRVIKMSLASTGGTRKTLTRFTTMLLFCVHTTEFMSFWWAVDEFELITDC